MVNWGSLEKKVIADLERHEGWHQYHAEKFVKNEDRIATLEKNQAVGKVKIGLIVTVISFGMTTIFTIIIQIALWMLKEQIRPILTR